MAEVQVDQNNLIINFPANNVVHVVDGEGKTVLISEQIPQKEVVTPLINTTVQIEPRLSTIGVKEKEVKVVEVKTGLLGPKGDSAPFLFIGNNTWYTPSNIIVSASLAVQSNVDDLFLVKNAAGATIFEVSQSGVVTVATQSQQLTDPAPHGGIYFTSNAFFVGLGD